MPRKKCSSALDWEYFQFIFLNVFPLMCLFLILSNASWGALEKCKLKQVWGNELGSRATLIPTPPQDNPTARLIN